MQVALAALEPRDETLVVAYGDMPLVDATIFEDVQAAVDADAGTALGLVTARMPLPSNFGRVVRNGATVEQDRRVPRRTTAERAIDEMNAGIYAFDETRAARRDRQLDRPDNAQGELYLTDTVALLVAGIVSRRRRCRRSTIGSCWASTIGSSWPPARATMNERLCHAHMRDGVTIVDPATTYLEPGIVDRRRHDRSRPNTSIGGDSVLGERTRIGPNARLYNVAPRRRRRRVTDSVVIDTAIGARTSRSGRSRTCAAATSIGAGARVGNFVELKNTRMAAGAKASHLAYLGDATIGENTNIGAGTITCNYDGVNKNPTDDRPRRVHRLQHLAGRAGDDRRRRRRPAPATVVIRDVPAGDRVVGNPARSIGAKKAAST